MFKDEDKYTVPHEWMDVRVSWVVALDMLFTSQKRL